jgi:hypothetical protein
MPASADSSQKLNHDAIAMARFFSGLLAGLRLFRGRAGASISNEPDDSRLRAADCSQYRQQRMPAAEMSVKNLILNQRCDATSQFPPRGKPVVVKLISPP